jgi:predicted nucleotidyltransferase
VRFVPPVAETPAPLKFRVLYGSHAHGTATPTSDQDWRGMFQVDTETILGLERTKDTFEVKATDQVYWELAQFVRLLLKGNPNLVGMLWTPGDCVFEMSNVAAALVFERESLITKAMVDAYHGWVYRELKDLQGKGLRSHGYTIPGKRLSHVPRLLWELQGALLDRHIPVRLEGERLKIVMAIKTGEMSTDDAMLFCGSLLLDTEQFMREKAVPVLAPFDLFNQIVLNARKGMYE